MNHDVQREACALATALLAVLAARATSAQTLSVRAEAETAPVPSSGDAADDAAIWVHPTHPGLSLVIGTDKQSGLAVYDLAGNQRQFLAHGRLNNVDLRYGFPLAGAQRALVTAGERDGNLLAVYVVEPSTRTLRAVAARAITLGNDVYGCCMYQSPVTGEFYFFGTSDGGVVEQWRLFDDGTGKVDATHVRSFDVGGQSEGCAADDENGWFFVGEEEVGIWRYGAEPGDGDTRLSVDVTGAGGHLDADVEGLGLYYAPGGGGYLLASSQGNSSFAIYRRRPPHIHLLSFTVADQPQLGIDAVSGTDGLEVINLGLGSAFPSGLLVVQDDSNSGANQNFKLVDWSGIAALADPPLAVAPRYDALGAGHVRPPRGCTLPSTEVRFGSLPNPFLLASASEPVLGSTWQVDLDCSGHAPARGHVFLFMLAGQGTFLPAGELLVDTASVRLLLQTAAHSGGVLRFRIPVPPMLSLCGFPATAQGLCGGAPQAALSNAIDLVFGQG